MFRQATRLKEHRTMSTSLVLVLTGFSLVACSSIYTLTPDNTRSLEQCMKALGWTTEGPEGATAYGKTYYRLGATRAAYKRNYRACAAEPVDHLHGSYANYYYLEDLPEYYSGHDHSGDSEKTPIPSFPGSSTPAKSSHPRNRLRPR